jgi:hypothetical protein
MQENGIKCIKNVDCKNIKEKRFPMNSVQCHRLSLAHKVPVMVGLIIKGIVSRD